ncbi:MAG: hypothetical protein CMD14_07465 [Flavobacteriales bacterium]|nr:hypothetical protein [Flavobacteriales bacterium]|tara:strand:- start:14354 stop:14977 length:624 start_codon:yes stop_codon:yes gene_type:complete
MKKLFTILLISCFAFNTSFAQVEGQGTVILGATTELGGTPWSLVTMEPTIGYFFTDQFALGMKFALANTKDETELGSGSTKWTETTTVNSLTMGPWMRFYTNDIFFINAGIAMTSGSNKEETDDKNYSGWVDSDGNLVSEKESTSFGLSIEAGAGASILWGDYIAFEPMVVFDYGTSSQQPWDEDKIKGPRTINLGFKIGVCVMLPN